MKKNVIKKSLRKMCENGVSGGGGEHYGPCAIIYNVLGRGGG